MDAKIPQKVTLIGFLRLNKIFTYKKHTPSECAITSVIKSRKVPLNGTTNKGTIKSQSFKKRANIQLAVSNLAINHTNSPFEFVNN